MKLILSRKGFDSGAGGVASPIMPDGAMFSLPIPDESSAIRYKDIFPHGPLVRQLTKGKVNELCGAHLDPDLFVGTIPRQPGWKPIFGQCGMGQRVLERADVGPGDIFLYFGWFRRVERRSGVYMYVPDAPDLHVIWGWMQIGTVLKVNSDNIPGWARYHPHISRSERRESDTVYLASDTLMIGGADVGAPGAGVFGHYEDHLCLTAPGRRRGFWSLPGWFYPIDEGRTPLGYHRNPDLWSREGDNAQLKTMARGQEFVLDADEYPEVGAWVRGLLEKSV